MIPNFPLFTRHTRKKIGEKEGKKITRMCNVLNSEDVRKLTFCCIISLVKQICANKRNSRPTQTIQMVDNVWQ